MARNTIYCSQCGKGNIVESIADVSQFICISCNAVNTLKIPEQGTRRLKDVYEKNQQSAGDRQSRMVTLRRKKTLVDKNIDLLERVEAMEHESLQMKNEYLELTKELSKVSAAAPAVDNGGAAIEEVREMFIGLQEIVLDVQEHLGQTKESPVSLDLDEIELRVMNALENTKKPSLDLDGVMQEFKTIQHVLNTVAGEVRTVKQDLSDLKSQVGEIKNMDFGSVAKSSNSSSSVSHGSYDAPRTTQILPVDSNENSNDRKESSVSVKPLKGSNKIRAMSEKLKNLKL